MPERPPVPGASLPRTAIAAVFLVLVFLLSSGPIASARSVAPIAPHEVGPVPAAPAVGESARASASAPPATAAPSPSIEFFNSTPVGGPSASSPCSATAAGSSVTSDCYAWSSDPTLVALPSGEVGLGVQSASVGTCAGATSTVLFERSSDGGASFGLPVHLSNATCSYPNSLEPTFASVDGTVYGVFVEQNGTGLVPVDHSDRASSRLAFVRSTTDGSSFGSVVTLPSGSNVADPRLAAVGSTLYVVYENLANSTSVAVPAGGPYGSASAIESVAPVAVQMIRSTDAGATWSDPVVLPEEGAASSYFSLGPSIAVGPTGTLEVAYFTNQRCVAPASFGCSDYGVDLVAATSTDNGSTFSSPTTVARGIGESRDVVSPVGGVGDHPFAWAPSSALTIAPSTGTVAIAWDGLAAPTDVGTSAYVAIENSSTSTWRVASLAVSPNAIFGSAFSSTAVAYIGATAEVSYTEFNESTCLTGTTCPFANGAAIERLVSSGDGGTTWSSPAIVDVTSYGAACSVTCAESATLGTESALLSSSAGTPILAFASPQPSAVVDATIGSVEYANTTFATNVEVASVPAGPGVAVTFEESGVASNNWTLVLQGVPVVVSGATTWTESHVPIGTIVYVDSAFLPGSNGGRLRATSSVGEVTSFGAPTRVYLNYSLTYQMYFWIAPSKGANPNYAGSYDALIEVRDGSTYDEVYEYADLYDNYRYYYGPYYSPAEPWTFTAGTVVTADVVDGISYYNGSGKGNYTGDGWSFNITMNGNINETGWIGGFGVYNETFAAAGIPSTSEYHYTFNGATYSAPASSFSIAPNTVTGAYLVSNIWANSSTAGWEYFGTPDVGTVVIVPAEPIVHLNFAYVDLGAPVGTISFRAAGLTPGTVWRFEFNGTEYSSNTSYINVTEHPGSFPVSGFPVVSSTGDTGYAPSGLPSFVGVTPGTPYVVNFSYAYRIDGQAGVGGQISGTGHGGVWIAAGGNVTFHAVALSNYQFGGWTGSGTGSYTGNDSYANFTAQGPTTEFASFYPLPLARFNLSVFASGLDSGTWWTVFLDGVGYSSDQPLLVIPDLFPCGTANGTYALEIPYASGVGPNSTGLTRFAPGAYPYQQCTNGATSLTVQFTTEYYLTLQSTAGGYGTLTLPTGGFTTSQWVPFGTTVGLGEISLPAYQFLGWNGTGAGNYTGVQQIATLVMDGPITEIAAFGLPWNPPAREFYLNLTTSTALEPGTAWAVELGGTGYSTTGPSINITGLVEGSYAYAVPLAVAPDGLAEYSDIGAPSQISLAKNTSISVAFTTMYSLTVRANPGGSIVAPTVLSGWYVAGSTVPLNAVPDAGKAFLGWIGTGPTAVSTAANGTSVRVTGPTVEVAEFGPAAPVAAAVATSFWALPTWWALLGIAGLVVGVFVGIVVGRRPPGPAAPMPSAPVEEPR